MIFPVQDPFWTETAGFIRETISPHRPFINPREFRAVLPRAFPYDWVHAIETLEQYDAVVIHKGLMHELPLPVLQALNDEWKKVFANAVFIVFMPVASPLPPCPKEHTQAFYDRLKLLEQFALAKKERTMEQTALLVIASRTPEHLDRTLNSFSLFHLPVFVLSARSDQSRQKSHGEVCSRHRAQWEKSVPHATEDEALESGIARFLADPDIDWIASFDDGMIARPDFLLVMEKFRSAKISPVLGGLWTGDDGVRASIFRDGFQIITPHRQNRRHLYGHRNFWREKFQTGTHSPESQVIPGLVMLQPD